MNPKKHGIIIGIILSFIIFLSIGAAAYKTIVGPLTSTTPNSIVRWDGSLANKIKNSGVLINDTNGVSGIADLAIDGQLSIEEINSSTGTIGILIVTNIQETFATYTGTNIVVDFYQGYAQWTLTNNSYLLTSTNRPLTNAVSRQYIDIIGDTSDRTIAFNSNWRRLGTNILTIPSNKIVGISFLCFGTNETGVRYGIGKEE